MSKPNSSKPSTPYQGVDSTPLFRIMNPELFMKPVRC